MIRPAVARLAAIAALAALAPAPMAAAETGAPSAPVVTVTAAASESVANDRMHAWLRAEAESASPAAAASEVNARVAKGIARAKAASGVLVATSGYTTQQIAEKGKPTRWRVAQTITVEGGDFAALATLLTKLQDDDGLLLSGMSFDVSPDTRRKSEDALTQQALRAWQERAQRAAQGLGYASWRPGRVTVGTGDRAAPVPMYRAQAMVMAAPAPAPVPVEAGTTDVTVTVSGEAVLDAPKAAPR
jgi:predicted secreted protein